ncbi:MAG: M50 family metallopeptidase [Magnetococcales bacterium]|nr:M50 family metallopeptidase [Magnetococcales bacterium]
MDRCPNCQSGHLHPQGKTRQGYPIQRCLECGRQFIGRDSMVEPSASPARYSSARKQRNLKPRSRRSASRKTRLNLQKSFFGTALLVVVISSIPILNFPFEWLYTFFHELSHAVVAFLTGGTVRVITIQLAGGGAAWIYGGVDVLVGWAGYGGSVLWGMGLFMTTLGGNLRRTVIWTGALMGTLALATVLWVRDGETLFITTTIYVVWMSALLRARKNPATKLTRFVRFAGLYVLLNAIMAPVYLIGYQGHSDARALHALTGIPQPFWIISWIALGLYALLVLYALHVGEIKLRDRKQINKSKSLRISEISPPLEQRS